MGRFQEGGLRGLLRSESLCLLSARQAVPLGDRSSESTVDREVRRADSREVAGVPSVVRDVHQARLGGEEYCRRLAVSDACLRFFGEDKPPERRSFGCSLPHGEYVGVSRYAGASGPVR